MAMEIHCPHIYIALLQVFKKEWVVLDPSFGIVNEAMLEENCGYWPAWTQPVVDSRTGAEVIDVML